jgi:hypothetical protein
MTKNSKKNSSCKTFIFFGSKIASYLSLDLHKRRTAQATGEAYSSQKRTSSTSKQENSLLFSVRYLWVIFVLLDPDPATQINADPFESGSTILSRIDEKLPLIVREECCGTIEFLCQVSCLL